MQTELEGSSGRQRRASNKLEKYKALTENSGRRHEQALSRKENTYNQLM